MKRKNISLAVAAAAVLVAAAYPASSWYFGRQIEAAHAEIDAKIAALPYLKLIRHDYERGLFDASETITVEIPAALFRMPPLPAKPARPQADEAAPETSEPPQAQQASPAPAPALPPLRITLKTAVRHGPFPDFSAFAAGSATTVVEFDEAIQKKVLEAFGGKPAAEIRTLYDFAGGGRSTVASPAFRIDLPGPTEGSRATLSGDGLEMSVEFTRGMEQYSMHGGAPRFELAEADGPRLTLTGLGIEGRQQRLFPDEPLLYVGSQRFSLAGLDIDPGQDDNGKKPRIALKELQYDVQVPASGEFVDLAARIGAASVRVGEQDYGPAAYDFSLKHLHARKLMALHRDVMALYAQPETLQDQQRLMQALAPMKDKFVALLLDGPVLSIDRIAFRLPEGEAKLNASVRLVEARAEDFASPPMLIGKLDAAAELSLPTALATTLALAGGKTDDEEAAQRRRQGAEQAIDNLVRQGYATVDNGMLKSRLTFKGGRLLVNDKPFNPMAVAPQPTQEP